MAFREYLAELADRSTRLTVSGLARLSDLSPEQEQALSAAWSGIDVRRRKRIVQELIDLAEDNVELDFDAIFFRGLTDDNADVRVQSIRGLWEHVGPRLIEPLLGALTDDDAGVRAEAALALGRYVTLFQTGRLRERYFREVEAGLRRVIDRGEEVEEVRARALEAIGAYNGAWVRQAIREAYESGVRRLKVSAVHAMGRSCEDRWLPLVTRELSNEEAEVRYEAAVACGSLGDERAVGHLVRALEDPDEEVRQASVVALGEIGGAEAKHALLELADNPSASLREAAAFALSQVDFEEDPLAFKYRT